LAKDEQVGIGRVVDVDVEVEGRHGDVAAIEV
jgi:hypothetical protein